MNLYINDIAEYHAKEAAAAFVENICLQIRKHPIIIEQTKGSTQTACEILHKEGFEMYSTVKKTTLIYDKVTDLFLKIVHPISLGNKINPFFRKRSRTFHRIAEDLLSRGVKVPEITAYGVIKRIKAPFFVMKRVKGESLFDLTVRNKKKLDLKLYYRVIEEIANVHKTGYWFGDFHLSHVIIDDSEITGLIDIDGIRRNKIFLTKHYAKDLAGFIHPGIPVSDDIILDLLQYYMRLVGFKDKEKLLLAVKNYSEIRWKK